MKALDESEPFEELSKQFVLLQFDWENDKAEGREHFAATRNNAYFLVLDPHPTVRLGGR